MERSQYKGFILTLMFGPLGLFYSSVPLALVILALAVISDLLMPGLFLLFWALSIIASVFAVHLRNSKANPKAKPTKSPVKKSPEKTELSYFRFDSPSHRSPNAKTKTQGNARWVMAGTDLKIQGFNIQGGFFYVGGQTKETKAHSGEIEVSLIDPTLRIDARSPNYSGDSMAHYRGYNGISPQSRAAYLEWLAGDRSDPETYIGYVFLYFYGIERRLILDDRDGKVSNEERNSLIHELKRLKKVYSHDHTFHGYVTDLLSHVWVINHQILGRRPDDDLLVARKGFSSIFKFQLASAIENGDPVDAPLALAWVKSHPEFTLRTAARRCPDEFDALFKLRYRGKFGDGIAIQPNETRLQLEYHPCNPSLYSHLTVKLNLPDVSLLKTPVKKLNILAEACMAELDSPNAKTKTEGNARWVMAGQDLNVQGFKIRRGFFYVGGQSKETKDHSGESDVSLIDPTLRIDARSPNYSGDSMAHYRGYNGISPQSRAAYLEWLAGGRSDRETYIGYVFLYFYGIERRLILDDKDGKVSNQERNSLIHELKRLKDVYSHDHTFHGYVTDLLSHVWVINHQILGRRPDDDLLVARKGFSSIFKFQLASAIENGDPVDAPLALAWVKSHPEFTLRTAALRSPDEFDALFKLRYRGKFGDGLEIQPNETRLQLEYLPCNPSLYGHQTAKFDLPDVSLLKTPVKKLNILAGACTAELDSFSRFVGRQGQTRSSLRALSLLPDDLIASVSNSRFESLQGWMKTQLSESNGLVTVESLFQRFGEDLPLKINEKEAEMLSNIPEKAGFGIAPDSRFHHVKPDIDGKLVLFEGGHGKGFSPSGEFRKIGTMLGLGTLVASIDGNVSDSEVSALNDLIDQNSGLSETEKRSLHAYMTWRLHSPPNTEGLEGRLDALGADEKVDISKILIAVALADGRIDPAEINQLERLYTQLGLDKAMVASDIHNLSSGRMSRLDQESGTTSVIHAKSTEATSSPFTLDRELLRQREEETKETPSVLGSTFVESKDHARWVMAGQDLNVQGFKIRRGFFYVGGQSKETKDHSGEIEVSLIDPTLRIDARSPNYSGDSMAHYRGYNGISPQSRAAYLEWLAGDRSDRETYIGYVFLYFYGIERRLILDDKDGKVSSEERNSLIHELKRLKDVYSHDHTFHGYVTDLLSHVWVINHQVLGRRPDDDLLVARKGFSSIFKFQLASAIENGDPVDAPLALAWVKSHPEFTLRTAARRCPDEFDALFKLRYRGKFGDGLEIQPNETRLQLEYLPCNPSLYGHQTAKFDLPDVSRLKTPVKKLNILAGACTAELDSFSRFVGRQGQTHSSLRALSLLPDDLIASVSNSRFESLQGWMKTQLNESNGLVTVESLFQRFGEDAPLNINTKEAETLSNIAERAGFGIAPDSRFHHVKPDIDGKLVLFEGGHGKGFSPSGDFKTIGTMLELGTLVASIDGNVSDSEVSALNDLIDQNSGLSEIEKRSLHAYMTWGLHSPPNTEGLEGRLDALGADEKVAISKILIAVALADGRIDPTEINQLERLYTLLGLDKAMVASDIHNLSSGRMSRPDQESGPTSVIHAKSTEATSSPFTLDRELLRQREEETKEAQSVLGSTFVESKDHARWVMAGQDLNVQGFKIRRGFFYVGGQSKETKDHSGEIEVSLIDPTLRIDARSPNYSGDSRAYFRGYNGISPQSRAAYLEWLAGDRSDRETYIGYVFLYFYGIERRLILDDKDGKVSSEERNSLIHELKRLKDVYSHDHTFHGYVTDLLSHVWVINHQILGRRPDDDLLVARKGFSSIFKFQLASAIENGDPVDAPLALAWVKSHPEFTLGTAARRYPDEFDALFKLRYRGKFGDGIAIQPNETRLQLEYRPCNPSLHGHLPVELDLPDVSLLKTPVKNLRILAEACMAELDSLNAKTMTEGHARWVMAGQDLNVQGFNIQGGFFYVGAQSKETKDHSGEIEVSLIDPTLRIDAKSPNYSGDSRAYYRGYNGISPQSRAAYLEWLAGDRSDPETYIGYVFLYFYGIERRLILDDKDGKVSSEERNSLIHELKRLKDVYSHDHTFHGYVTDLLSHVWVINHQILGRRPDDDLLVAGKGFTSVFKFQLASAIENGDPVDAPLALAWVKSHPEFTLRTAALRSPDEFDALFKLRYRGKFGDGLEIQPNETRLQLEYHPCNPSLNGHLTVELDLPDVSLLKTPVKKLNILAEACIAELDSLNARTKTEGHARWVMAGQDLNVQGFKIRRGFFYVGGQSKETKDHSGEIEVSLIDPTLRIDARSPNYSGDSMAHYRGYNGISPQSRAAYLEWLAGDRSDRETYIGYVFLYFYGIERRLIFDDRDGKVSSEERNSLIHELKRLKDVYSHDHTFHGYVTDLLSHVWVINHQILGRRPDDDLLVARNGFTSVFKFQLASAIENGDPVDASLALAWVKSHPEFTLRTAALRSPDEFDALFKLRYRGKFGDGIAVQPNETRLQLEYRPCNPSLHGHLTVKLNLPDVSLLKTPVEKLRILAEDCIAELDSPNAKTKTEGHARWVMAGQDLNVQGFNIQGGFFYVGGQSKETKDHSGEIEVSLIDPTLRIDAKSPNYSGDSMAHYRGYNGISPQSRAAYLEWLAGDRSDPETYIGYVFLYFYGIERRLILDDKDGKVSNQERNSLIHELKRLKKVYSHDHTFHGYVTALLSHVWVINHQILGRRPDDDLLVARKGFSSIFKFQLASAIENGDPVDAPLALAWVKSHPEFTLGTAARRYPDEFDALFKLRYRGKFGDGIAIQPNETRLQLEYRPCNPSLHGHLPVELDLPDVSLLRTPVKKLHILAEACMAELDSFSRSVGRQGQTHSSLLAPSLLPDDLIAPVSNSRFENLKSWMKTQLNESNGLVTVESLFQRFGEDAPLKINTKEAETLSNIAERAGFGIAPDSRFHHVKPDIDGKLALFEGGHGKGFSPSGVFKTIGTMLRLGTLVASIDGDVSDSEVGALNDLIDQNSGLSETEKRSLHAYMTWRLHSPPNTEGLEGRLDALGADEKVAISKILIAVALADGRIDPAEINQLERLYTLLGLDKAMVARDIHNLSSSRMSRPDQESGPTSATPATPAKPKEATASRFTLDRELLRQREEETKEAQSVLGSIFAEEEPTVNSEVERADVVAPGNGQPLGLDAPYLRLYEELITRETWTYEELQGLCSGLKLMTDGGIDPAEINQLERLYTLLGLDKAMVARDIHNLSSSRMSRPDQESRPTSATSATSDTSATSATPATPAKPKEATSSRFTLDRELLRQFEEETKEAQSVLGSIFAEEEPTVDAEVEKADVVASGNGQPLGLDAPHLRLYEELITRETWTYEELQGLCSGLQLMTDGAVETINDWAFERVDAPLIEDGSTVYVDIELAEEITALPTQGELT